MRDQTKGFRFLRRHEGSSEAVNGLFPDWSGDGERWLFIVPHDDDACIGAGLLLQAAAAREIPTSVIITTDGSMGYCNEAERERIVEIRHVETLASLRLLGMRTVTWLGFPDCDLVRYQGRRRAVQADPAQIAGFTGLQNAYTSELRRFRPTRLFLPTPNDIHPDHKIVSQEALISVFHAGGAIWPELGEPLRDLPGIYEMAIYCAFSGEPDLMVEADPEHFSRKLEAIAAYRSQEQIERIVDNVRSGGAAEFFKNADLRLYSPGMYASVFGRPLQK
ncbi:MAG TPA: PIG-L family deacetylase [Spirochaetia bacterium]|nr:PIG-L family deacetylase [Spirochaetia bacterium]